MRGDLSSNAFDSRTDSRFLGASTAFQGRITNSTVPKRTVPKRTIDTAR